MWDRKQCAIRITKPLKYFFFKNLENESFDKFETTKIDENNKTSCNETGRKNR